LESPAPSSATAGDSKFPTILQVVNIIFPEIFNYNYRSSNNQFKENINGLPKQSSWYLVQDLLQPTHIFTNCANNSEVLSAMLCFFMSLYIYSYKFMNKCWVINIQDNHPVHRITDCPSIWYISSPAQNKLHFTACFSLSLKLSLYHITDDCSFWYLNVLKSCTEQIN
jgi:hypothetical protein